MASFFLINNEKKNIVKVIMRNIADIQSNHIFLIAILTL